MKTLSSHSGLLKFPLLLQKESLTLSCFCKVESISLPVAKLSVLGQRGVYEVGRCMWKHVFVTSCVNCIVLVCACVCVVKLLCLTVERRGQEGLAFPEASIWCIKGSGGLEASWETESKLFFPAVRKQLSK